MAHNQKLILELLKIEGNDECADCGRKGNVYGENKIFSWKLRFFYFCYQNAIKKFSVTRLELNFQVDIPNEQ